MPKPDRADLARYIACGVLVLATLPYLALKIHWLAGGRTGLNNLADSTQLTALNSFTAGMDFVAALLAAVFAFGWGRRVAAWLILFPIWVGTGLLGQVLLAAPLQILVSTVVGQPLLPESDGTPRPVENWVFGVVYAGFFTQGVALLTAFLLYARRRWPAAFEGRVGDRPPTPSALRAVTVLLATAVAVGLTLLALLAIAWSAGFTGGLSAGHAESLGVSGRTTDASMAVLALLAAAGLLMSVRGWGPRTPRWAATAAAWVGTGAMFGWGMWTVVVLLASDAGVGIQYAPDLSNHVALANYTLGLVGGLAYLLSYAERGV